MGRPQRGEEWAGAFACIFPTRRYCSYTFFIARSSARRALGDISNRKKGLGNGGGTPGFKGSSKKGLASVNKGKVLFNNSNNNNNIIINNNNNNNNNKKVSFSDANTNSVKFASNEFKKSTTPFKQNPAFVKRPSSGHNLLDEIDVPITSQITAAPEVSSTLEDVVSPEVPAGRMFTTTPTRDMDISVDLGNVVSLSVNVLNGRGVDGGRNPDPMEVRRETCAPR